MESERDHEPSEPSHVTEAGSDGAPFAPVDTPPQLSPASALPPAPALPPYPTDPHGYPPYGYGYQQPRGGTNGMAIAAFVLGICGFLVLTPIVGLVLGLVALATVGKSGQKGKHLAISGIALSSVWIAVFATIIVVAAVNQPVPPRRDAEGTVVGRGVVSAFGLHPKDCFTGPKSPTGSTGDKARSFTVVPCSTPHDSEALGSFPLLEPFYPSVDDLRAESTSQCLKVLSGYVPDPASLPVGSRVEFVYPDERAWGHGQHQVTCFLQFPAATMTQSVHRDASSYTADQRRFLDAERPVADVLSQLSATPKSADLTVLRQRASDVASATEHEISALTSAPWPADVEPAVDALVADHTAADRLWTRAAADPDLTSFTDDARQAGNAYNLKDLEAVRAALGLTTGTAAAGGAGEPDQAA